MRLTSTMFLPLLVPVDDTRYGADHLLEEFTEDLDVGYSFGPPYGQRLVTRDDLDRLGLDRRELRRRTVDNLYRLLSRLRIDGQPPAPMLSFGGLESSVLLAADVWDDLHRSVPGELVVGVPARDVVIFTGTGSPPGMAKVRRAVDRIFFAGDQHLLSRNLLVWRHGAWSTLPPEPELELAAGPERLPDPGEPPEPTVDRWTNRAGPPRSARWVGRDVEPEPPPPPRPRGVGAGPTDWPERPPRRRSGRGGPRPNGRAR